MKHVIGLLIVLIASTSFAHYDVVCDRVNWEDENLFVLHFKGGIGSALQSVEEISGGHPEEAGPSVKWLNVKSLTKKNTWPEGAYVARLKNNKRSLSIHINESFFPECEGCEPEFTGSLVETSSNDSHLQVEPISCTRYEHN